MDSRIFDIFLRRGLAVAVLCVTGMPAIAQQTSEAPQVIQPQVERREIKRAEIDTEDFEVGAFAGVMSVEDFETNGVYGLSLAYHVNESIFVQGNYGTTDVGESSIERINPDVDLLGGDRTLSYYNVSLGYNIFPGEFFFGANRAINTNMYLIGGLGSTDFAGDENFTINYGFGVQFFPTDWISVRLDAQDLMMDAEILGESKTMHNLQGTVSLTMFF